LHERYDPEIAARFLAGGNAGAGGLPGYLGLELVKFDVAKLWARATIREELLTPFGTAHGGVVAAIVDHVTGVVVYPLMKPGQWAATTEIKTNSIAHVKAGLVESEATVHAMTNRSAIVRAELYYGERMAAAAQATLTIVDPR
jgi:uncharacterized protein (TIGR00369 family)